MSSIRCIGSIAFSAISLSTITSGNSYLSVLYNFFIVFNRMKLHSLQAHVLSLGGAGINSLSGLFFFISCNIPDSVATMKRLQSDCVAKRKRAAVEPTCRLLTIYLFYIPGEPVSTHRDTVFSNLLFFPMKIGNARGKLRPIITYHVL